MEFAEDCCKFTKIILYYFFCINSDIKAFWFNKTLKIDTYIHIHSFTYKDN